MGTTFKRTGEKRWSIAWQDEQGKRRSKRSSKDRRVAQEELRQLEDRAERLRLGMPVEKLASDVRTWQVAATGYRADLERQGRSAGYITTTIRQLTDVGLWCRWDSIEAMRADRLTEFLSHVAEHGLDRPELVRDGKRQRFPKRVGKPVAPRTCNAYRDAASGFAAWCVSQGWLESNPLSRVPKAKLGAPGDLSRRPRARRALTVAEFAGLIACEKIPQCRRELYELAGLSGLRAKELNHVAPCDFTLGARPMLHLRPEITKGKRLDRVPLLPECSKLLTRLVSNMTPLCRLFPRRPHHRTIAADFRRAGIAHRDERGRYANGHSLRYFFCCLVGRVLPIQRVRVLLRHQDIRTTCNLYLDLGIEDLADTLETLPSLFEEAKRTANQDGIKMKQA